ncbi:MAG: DUF3015 family protein [Oligoflexales bacterium]
MKPSLLLAKSSFLIFVLCKTVTAHAYHYGMAGCGLGSLIFEDQKGKVQLAAATLNNWVVPQTSAITSGTSGCYDTSENMADLFFKSNKQAILQEIAFGQGEALDGISKIYGCIEPTNLNKALRKQYSAIVGEQNPSADELRYNIESVIRNNSALLSTCKELA